MKHMNKYFTKLIDSIITIAGLVLGIYLVDEVFEIYDGFLNFIVPVGLGIISVILKTMICSLASNVLAAAMFQRVTEQLKKEAE